MWQVFAIALTALSAYVFCLHRQISRLKRKLDGVCTAEAVMRRAVRGVRLRAVGDPQPPIPSLGWLRRYPGAALVVVAFIALVLVSIAATAAPRDERSASPSASSPPTSATVVAPIESIRPSVPTTIPPETTTTTSITPDPLAPLAPVAPPVILTTTTTSMPAPTTTTTTTRPPVVVVDLDPEAEEPAAQPHGGTLAVEDEPGLTVPLGLDLPVSR